MLYVILIVVSAVLGSLIASAIDRQLAPSAHQLSVKQRIILIIASFLVLLALTAITTHIQNTSVIKNALSPTIQPGVLINLSGIWSADGYQCGNLQPTERVEITQQGVVVVATKLIGDPCIKANEITWETNSYTTNPFNVLIHYRDQNGPQTMDGIVHIKSNEELEITFPNNNRVLYRRLNQ